MNPRQVIVDAVVRYKKALSIPEPRLHYNLIDLIPELAKIAIDALDQLEILQTRIKDFNKFQHEQKKMSVHSSRAIISGVLLEAKVVDGEVWLYGRATNPLAVLMVDSGSLLRGFGPAELGTDEDGDYFRQKLDPIGYRITGVEPL